MTDHPSLLGAFVLIEITFKESHKDRIRYIVGQKQKKELYAFSNLISEWKKHLLVNTQHVISSQTNENNKQVLH